MILYATQIIFAAASARDGHPPSTHLSSKSDLTRDSCLQGVDYCLDHHTRQHGKIRQRKTRQDHQRQTNQNNNPSVSSSQVLLSKPNSLPKQRADRLASAVGRNGSHLAKPFPNPFRLSINVSL